MADRSTIKEHMEVLATGREQVGFVDRVEKDSIKLTKDSEGANGEHRFIPLAWVARVDDQVHLGRAYADVRAEWTAHATEDMGG